jgi:hypothetical protein
MGGQTMNKPRKRLGELTPAERAEVGLKALKRGRRCERWVCREYLALPYNPSVEEVIKAVHDGIHAAAKEKNPLAKRQKMVASVKAGSIVLSAMSL